MELINFLIEHFYFSAPLVIILILFFISNSKKGGTKISCQSLISLSNQDQALIVDLRSSEAFNSGHITASINIPVNDVSRRSNEIINSTKSAVRPPMQERL